METLKSNIKNITDDAENIVKDHLKLFSIRQSEKLAKVLGILVTVFLISILLLVVILFCSFAAAVYLNDILAGNYWGFWIVAGFYVLLILFIVVKMVSSKTPLLSNLFMKFIIIILDIDTNHTRDIKGMQLETELIRNKIESDKTHLKTNIQLLRYSFLESIFKEVIGLFSPKMKRSKRAARKNSQTKTQQETKK